MRKTEYDKLVVYYGEAKANKAVRWFVASHTLAFRQSVQEFTYCKINEFCWF